MFWWLIADQSAQRVTSVKQVQLDLPVREARTGRTVRRARPDQEGPLVPTARPGLQGHKGQWDRPGPLVHKVCKAPSGLQVCKVLSARPAL